MELEERLRFETLLADLSSKFINLPAGEVDHAILDAERSLCEILGLDVAGLWQWSRENPGNLSLSHLFGTVAAPLPQPMQASEYFPWYQQQMSAGRTVSLHVLGRPPSGGGPGSGSLWLLRHQIQRHRPARGRRARHPSVPWVSTPRGPNATGLPQLVERLQLVAQIFTNALARRRSELALQQSEERLQLAAESAEAGLWSLNLTTNSFWLTPKTRELFGFGLEDTVTFDHFLSRVDPRDRDAVVPDGAGPGGLSERRPGRIPGRPARGHRALDALPGPGARDGSGHPAHLTGVSIRITQQRRLAEQQLEDLRFGTLIAELSSKSSTFLRAEVDGAIEEAQRRVCEFLGLDLSALWQPVVEAPGDYRLTHHYRAVGGPPIDRMRASDNFPWCQQQLLAGQVIAVSSMDQLPPQAARDREVWRHFEVKTSLSIPLSTGGGPAIGFLSFNDLRQERDWPKALVQRLQVVAQIFTNALARKSRG